MRHIPILMLILLLSGCSSSESYRVNFEVNNRLDEQVRVYMLGVEVGYVKKIIMIHDQQIQTILSIDSKIQLMEGSTFEVVPDYLGGCKINIIPSGSREQMNPAEIHQGTTVYLEPGQVKKELTAEERDSLSNELVKAIFNVIRHSNDTIKFERTGK